MVGTNDAANIAAGANVSADERIRRMMNVIGTDPVLWVDAVTQRTEDAYRNASMRAWNEELYRVTAEYPNAQGVPLVRRRATAVVPQRRCALHDRGQRPASGADGSSPGRRLPGGARLNRRVILTRWGTTRQGSWCTMPMPTSWRHPIGCAITPTRRSATGSSRFATRAGTSCASRTSSTRAAVTSTPPSTG